MLFRSLELALALNAVESLQAAIAALLKDDDQFLRSDAIRTLANVDNELTRQVLRDALLDSQPLVQQTAEATLRKLNGSDTVVAATDPARETVRLSSVKLTPLAAASSDGYVLEATP